MKKTQRNLKGDIKRLFGSLSAGRTSSLGHNENVLLTEGVNSLLTYKVDNELRALRDQYNLDERDFELLRAINNKHTMAEIGLVFSLSAVVLAGIGGAFVYVETRTKE